MKGTHVTYNIHYFQLTKTEVQAVNKHISSALARAKADPSRFHVLIGGDFNFEYDRKSSVKLPEYTPLPRAKACYSAKSSGLAKTLGQATHFSHDQFSHYNARVSTTLTIFFAGTQAGSSTP